MARSSSEDVTTSENTHVEVKDMERINGESVETDAYQCYPTTDDLLGMESKKKRFPRAPSFMKRRANSVGNSKKNIDASCHATLMKDARLLEERNDAFEQCKRLKIELESCNDRVDQYENEVSLLKCQLRSLYRKELKSSGYDSEDTTDICSNIDTLAYGDVDPSEHHTRPCKECEKLLLTRVSALVEAITLRRYVGQLGRMTEGGETQGFLRENERKLTKTLAEKELLGRQLQCVSRERDRVTTERDKALQEWEKAASKWTTTLDQLDTLMIQQNEAKERDDTVISCLKDTLGEKEAKITEQVDDLEKLRQQCSEMEVELSRVREEEKERALEYDAVLKANYNIAQELRRVNAELKESRMKCSEYQASLEKTQILLERSKSNSDHIVKQWKQAAREKKRLKRELSGIAQSRDDAIQRNLSALAQLDRVRQERDGLVRSLTGTSPRDTAGKTSGCVLCGRHGDEVKRQYDEVSVFIPKSAFSQANITIEKVVVDHENRVVITQLDEEVTKQYDIRKYDEITYVNQQAVVKIEELQRIINEQHVDLNLTIRRHKSPFEITFDRQIPIVKKSKLGCGIHWGVYIKDLAPEGQAKISGNLETGDYINKINGKNLTKILSSALDKYSKRGDKMSVQICRRIMTSANCYCQSALFSLNDVNLRPRDKIPNRDSVISIESNQSLGASSVSSIPSHISSPDSPSVGSRTTGSESEYFKPDRRSGDVFMIEAGVPPTIAEESSTDDGMYHASGRRVRSLIHLGKPKYLKKESCLPRSQSLVMSLTNENTLRAKNISRGSSGPFYQSNGSLVSVKRLQPAAPAPRPANLAMPVSNERPRIIRLDKRSGEKLGLQINGGNCVGIYVVGFHTKNSAVEAGVRLGDRLIQLNRFSLNHVTLDSATRVLRMSDNCSYIRMEVQNYSNYEEVLKEGVFDSLYIRARLPYTASCEDEISYNIGDKLRVVNTRADYDSDSATWRWLAVRERTGENNEKVEGLIPAMNCQPDAEENGSSVFRSSLITPRNSEGDDIGVLSDETNLRGANQQRLRKNSVESLSKYRRYRGMKRRSSVESLGSENSFRSDSSTNKTTSYYEILEEKQV